MESIRGFKLKRYGVVLGRFQPLHIGHMEYLEAAATRCEKLVIGITNPDVVNIYRESSDPKRSLATSNPLTYFQRRMLIDSALVSCGWMRADFIIVPMDISKQQNMLSFLPAISDFVVLTTIYDDWGHTKTERLRNDGFDVNVLWKRSMASRLTSGTEIRNKINQGLQWNHLVPNGMSSLLNTYLLDKDVLARFKGDIE